MEVHQHQKKWSNKQENLKIKIFSSLVQTLTWCQIKEDHTNFNTHHSHNLKSHVLTRDICRLQATEMNFLQIKISNTDHHQLINI